MCGERLAQMIDKNRCFYLSIEDRASDMKNNIYDLMNAYFEEFLEGHYCDSCKSSNNALAKKVVNTPKVITCVIKRYENQKATSNRRDIIHPDLQLDTESSNNAHYQLRTIIVHKSGTREPLTTGHYTTFIFYNKVKVEIDDGKVLISEINIDSDLSILRDGYIYIYENSKIFQILAT